MEVMDKITRTVLSYIAAKGPEGAEVEDVYRGLSLIFDRDSLAKSITNLIARGYVNVLRDGDSTKLIASKNVRLSVLALELQKLKLAAYIKSLASKRQELVGLPPEKKADEERRISLEIWALLGQSLSTLARSTPELTVPEFVEVVEKLWSPLLSALRVEIVPDSVTSEEFLTLAKKLLGESESRAIEALLRQKKAVDGNQGSDKNNNV
ncbi:MAG: hypothetical protein RXR13_00225 [Sulfolobaceae archaeon]|jgi:hypothetical protein|nr:hypothetical protein [Sulfolobales archaeon]MCQ4450085.1 hypothetical protein [Sulfolobales archaeon]PVU71817.1 hypothetical protein DDW10_05060 [Sulfolobales archaeon SCGC AB-777_J03]